MATRAEERARGYRRPFERAGLTEYRYRTALGRGGGHRGPADAARAIRSADAVTSAISGRDERGRVTKVTILVTGRDGLTRSFDVKRTITRDPRRQAAADRRFDQRLRRLGKTIGTSDAAYVTGSAAISGERFALDDYAEAAA